MEVILVITLLVISFFFLAEFLKAILDLVKVVVPVIFLCCLGFIFLQSSFADSDERVFPEQAVNNDDATNQVPTTERSSEQDAVAKNPDEQFRAENIADTVIVYLDSQGNRIEP